MDMEVSGWVSKHLACHKTSPGCYHLTHLKTGCAIPPLGLSFKTCKRFIERLESAPIPWGDVDRLKNFGYGQMVHNILHQIEHNTPGESIIMKPLNVTLSKEKLSSILAGEKKEIRTVRNARKNKYFATKKPDAVIINGIRFQIAGIEITEKEIVLNLGGRV